MACTGCRNGKRKRDCVACKSSRADQSSSPEINLEPEVKQEPFTIRGYFGFDDGE